MRTAPRPRPTPRTRRAVLTIVFAAAALPAASAQAATVEVTPDGTVVYYAAEGEANSLEVTSSRDVVRLRDLREPLSADGASCARIATRPAEVACIGAPAPLQRIAVNLGDRDDALSVRTGIPTIVDAGPGADILLAGAFAGASRVDILGGSGIDTADYSAATAALAVTRDGRDGDGRAGDFDNIRGDVEVVIGQGASAATRRRLRCAPLRRSGRARAYGACLRRA